MRKSSRARGSYNSFYLDGGQNTSPEYNNLIASPSIDAIQEFRIETSSYSARYGQAGGAIVSVVTKGGGNAYHGSLYEYHRNKVLDALPMFYRGEKKDFPNSLWNQFGGTIGGPIRKNKTFFFGNLELFRQLSGGQQMLSFAPTAAERVGDIRNSINPWAPPSLSVLTNPYTGEVIPSGILPPSLVNPVGVKLMNLWPAANYNVGNALLNYRVFRARKNTTNKYLGRIDQNFGTRDFLTGTFNYGNYDIGQPGFIDNGDKVFSQHDRTLTLNWTHSFRPNLINVFGATGTHYFSGDHFRLNDKNYGRKWGLDPSVNVIMGPPYVILWTEGFQLFPIGGNPDNKGFSRAGYFHDDLSWQKGSHTLQMGGIFWRQKYNWQYFSGGAVYYMNLLDCIPGLWFLFGVTGSAFTDLLAAIPNLYQIGFGGGTYNHFQRDTYGLYFQDDWKVTRRLTLNYGIRWEYEQPFKSTDGKFMAIDYDTGLIRYAAGAPGLDVIKFPYETGGTDLSFRPHKLQFMPRFGLAFRPFKSDKTVLRGGYGIFDMSEPAYVMRYGAFATPFGGVASYWSKGIVGGWPADSNPPYGDHLRTLDQPPYGLDIVQGRAPISGWITNDELYPRSYAEQWNFTVGHDFGHDIGAELAYVGNQGINLNGIQSLSSFSKALNSKVTANYPGWGTAIQTKGFMSRYHSLQASVRKTTAHGLTFLAAYTWSHALAEASNDTIIENVQPDIFGTPEVYRKFWANAGFDVRHRVSVAGNYELPFGKGRRWGSNWGGLADKTLGGWNLNYIFTAQSGFPFSVLSASRLLTDRVCNGNLPKSQRTIQKWYDYSCFPSHYLPSGAENAGNSGTNIISGPGSNNWDLGIHKIIKLAEGKNLEFRMETFNTFNHPQLTTANASLASFFNDASGAEITGARDQRQIQFALRFTF
jgi:hypothetical protein